jgi:hypothetical protein
VCGETFVAHVSNKQRNPFSPPPPSPSSSVGAGLPTLTSRFRKVAQAASGRQSSSKMGQMMAALDLSRLPDALASANKVGAVPCCKLRMWLPVVLRAVSRERA